MPQRTVIEPPHPVGDSEKNRDCLVGTPVVTPSGTESVPPTSPSQETEEEITEEEIIDGELKVRPPRFDAYLRLAPHATLKPTVTELIQGIQNTEEAMGEGRKRRSHGLRTLAEGTEASVANLAHARLLRTPSVRLSRDTARHGGRYVARVGGAQLPGIHNTLNTMGVLSMNKGERATAFSPGRQTEIEATAWLVNRMQECGTSLRDFIRLEGEELVLLKDKAVGRTEWLEYDDTELTDAYRAEVRIINRHLRGADINHYNDALRSTALVDPYDRHLRRHFTRGDFASGGRLFGGFWQKVSKEERLENTLINGEAVVSVDFKSMIAQQAYGFVGADMPMADAYDIRFTSTFGTPHVLPRSTVKKLFASLMFDSMDRERWPRGLATSARGFPVGRAIDCIKAAHPAIAELFGKGLGHGLMFDESQIMVHALLDLIAQGITALPVHDCVVIPETAEAAACKAMSDAFASVYGRPGNVTVERVY